MTYSPKNTRSAVWRHQDGGKGTGSGSGRLLSRARGCSSTCNNNGFGVGIKRVGDDMWVGELPAPVEVG